ncbi:MAG: type VI secretion system tube protein Hcp [Verrucomicrobiae bacterium]|nr:type VI secretion system tube protein Hcp [Verrucomicrobiae bacterium]
MICSLASASAQEGSKIFLKIGDIKGEVTDADHKDWINATSWSWSGSRSIPEGAKDQQRTGGKTTLNDMTIHVEMGKALAKLLESTLNGTFYPEVELHVGTVIKNKMVPYFTLKLKNVVLTEVSVGSDSTDSAPTHEIDLNFTALEGAFITVDPETGDKKGNVPFAYDPGAGEQ